MVDRAEVVSTLERSVAFQAALDLVFTGLKVPRGYMGHALARGRREFKGKNAD
jgi:malate synthase